MFPKLRCFLIHLFHWELMEGSARPLFFKVCNSFQRFPFVVSQWNKILLCPAFRQQSIPINTLSVKITINAPLVINSCRSTNHTILGERHFKRAQNSSSSPMKTTSRAQYINKWWYAEAFRLYFSYRKPLPDNYIPILLPETPLI